MISEHQFEEVIETRARNPDAILHLARGRKRRAEFDEGRGLFLLTADDAARANLQIGADPVALGNRRRLLERLTYVLDHPAVDGLIGSADIIEELLLLGALHDKVVLGSMNRSGLAGSTWEVDDRFTAYDVATIAETNLDGGKLTLRLDWRDPGTNTSLAAAAGVIKQLARAGTVALVETLPVISESGRVRVAGERDQLLRALSVASGLGPTSARTWLKVPLVHQFEDVVSATLLPVLVAGGDPGNDVGAAVARWSQALAPSQVRGFVAGRSLLFPADGDVDRAVASVAEALGR